jgi:hypothetical protein
MGRPVSSDDPRRVPAARFTQAFGFEALYATAPSNRHASDWDQRIGGERGIRTPDTVSRIPVFKTGAFNRSAISPRLLQFYYSLQFSQKADSHRSFVSIAYIWPHFRYMGFQDHSATSPYVRSQRKGLFRDRGVDAASLVYMTSSLRSPRASVLRYRNRSRLHQ